MDRPPPANLVRSNTFGELQQIDDYKILHQLGEGSYGKVVLAQHIKSKEKFAVKIISQSILQNAFKKSKWLKSRRPPRPGAGPTPVALATQDDPENPENMLKREVAIMKKLNHKNVVRLIEVLQDDKSNDLFLVMEFVSGGTVMPEESSCDPIDEQVAWKYFRQLVEALDYCHTNGVIHCDIKPSNLLVTEDGDIKVADFGTSRMMDKTDDASRSSFDDTVSKAVGTAAFLSPQACRGGEYSGTASDVWAAGVTLYFMVFGECPFQGPGIATLYENIQNEDLIIPDEPVLSEDLKDLLCRVIEKDEKKRITVKELMNHPWVTKEGEHALEETQDFIHITQQDLMEAITRTKPIQSVVSMTIRLKKILGQAQESLAQNSTHVFDDVDYDLDHPSLCTLTPHVTGQALWRMRVMSESSLLRFMLRKQAVQRFNLDIIEEDAYKLPATESPNPSSALKAYQHEMVAAAAAASMVGGSNPPPLPPAPASTASGPIRSSSLRSLGRRLSHTSSDDLSLPSSRSSPLSQASRNPSSSSIKQRSRVVPSNSLALPLDTPSPQRRRSSAVSVMKERGLDLKDLGMSEEAELKHISHGIDLDLVAKCTHSSTAVFELSTLDSQDVHGAEDCPRDRGDRLLEHVIDFSNSYKSKRTNPVLVCNRFQAHCQIINNISGMRNPVVFSDGAAIAAQADAAKDRHDDSDELSVMDGVPVLVAWNVDVKSFSTGDGTGHVRTPNEDAFVVERLRNAGAIVVGKTHIGDLNLGSVGHSNRFGSITNPHDPTRCGGSGCAVAVAMGLCPVAVGTDEGGIGRISAALCGTVCVKPTYGRASCNGVLPLCPSSNHIVIHARSVTDAAIAYAITSGHDVDDETTHYQPRVILTNFGPGVSVRHVGVGVWGEWNQHADSDVVAPYAHFLSVFKDKVNAVHSIGIHHLDKALAALVVSMSSELLHYVTETAPSAKANLHDAQRLHLALARLLTSEHAALVSRIRTAVIEELKRLFAHFECIITPAVPCVAPELIAAGQDPTQHMLKLMRFVFLASITGFPCAVVPIGVGEHNLPVACLVLARPWHESTVLRLGRVIETCVPRRPRPAIYLPLASNRFSPSSLRNMPVVHHPPPLASSTSVAHLHGRKFGPPSSKSSPALVPRPPPPPPYSP